MFRDIASLNPRWERCFRSPLFSPAPLLSTPLDVSALGIIASCSRNTKTTTSLDDSGPCKSPWKVRIESVVHFWAPLSTYRLFAWSHLVSKQKNEHPSRRFGPSATRRFLGGHSAATPRLHFCCYLQRFRHFASLHLIFEIISDASEFICLRYSNVLEFEAFGCLRFQMSQMSQISDVSSIKCLRYSDVSDIQMSHIPDVSAFRCLWIHMSQISDVSEFRCLGSQASQNSDVSDVQMYQIFRCLRYSNVSELRCLRFRMSRISGVSEFRCLRYSFKCLGYADV